MKLEGSCHCGAVTFTVESNTPYPYQWCYCSICRKTAGGGGYAINIMGEADTLSVEGKEHISVYRSRKNERESYEEDGLGFSRRHFCSLCGSALWVHNRNYAQWVYPFASAIDTSLPKPAERREIMLDYAPTWCDVPDTPEDSHFPRYPDGGIEDWHKQRGLYGKP